MKPARPPLVRLAPGYEIPRIINGCWQLAADHRPQREEDGEATTAGLAQLADLGLTAFDCADIYTGVEARLGAFRRAWQASGKDVDALRIHTKLVPDLDVLPVIDDAYIDRIVARSQRRLGMQRLDLVQLHWWDFEIDGWLPTARSLEALRVAGQIERLGVTNFDAAHLGPLLEAGVEVVSDQVQFSLLDRRPAGALTGLCRENGIVLLTYGALAGGFLTDRWLGQPDPGAQLSNRSLVKYRLIIDELGGWKVFQELLGLLDSIARKHGVAIAHIATRWVLDRPAVAAVVLGAADAAHGKDTLRTFDVQLDAEDHKAIDAFLADHPGPGGDVYALERLPGGRHGAIMKKGLNQKGGEG